MSFLHQLPSGESYGEDDLGEAVQGEVPPLAQDPLQPQSQHPKGRLLEVSEETKTLYNKLFSQGM